MKKPHLRVRENRSWSNWHDTDGVGGTVERFYTPHNMWVDGTRARKRGFQPGLEGLCRVVRDAEQEGRQVRAVGSGWSLSDVAFTEQYFVNTSRLDYWFLGFGNPGMVVPKYRLRDRHKRMVFAQCGVQIKTLNNYLEARRLALPTSGASNGQTIVGAVSTGTHGSANRVGAMQDYILGLHVVAEGGVHYWIERKSRPVATQAFCDWLGAKRLRDDQLFKAALVSFGSFGLVHAVLFEAEPIYVLDRFVTQTNHRKVRGALSTLDMRGLSLPLGDNLPFHFEVVLNPYKRGDGDKGAFIRALYKRRLKANEDPPAPHPADGQLLRSEDLVSIAGTFSDALPGLIPGILQRQIARSVGDTGGALDPGTPGQHFGDSTPTGGGTSLEIGVPLARVRDAVDLIFKITAEWPFGAPLALRYVKATDATLGFTRFRPITCTLEMPGIDSARSLVAHRRIWKALRKSDIPHTYHWGQSLPQNPLWVRAGFGEARVNRWLKARRQFLSPAGRHMFSNRLVERCGLAT